MEWTEFSALSWCSESIQGEESYYWSREILELFRPLGHEVEEGENGENQHHENHCGIVSTSYETLLLLAAGVVQQIREEHSNVEDNAEKAVVFAVTIPEGPLLPLSVLVVHALNVFFHSTSYAVMVPMDLDEGKDRNSHILGDANPSFCLSIPGRDTEKLHDLVDGNHCETNTTTRILNMVNLAKVARRKVSMLLSKVDESYSEFIASATRDSTSLQSLVSNLATTIGALSSDAIDDESSSSNNKLSHIVYTSGTTGRPKGCVSSTRSLLHYMSAKNEAHEIDDKSVVLLASALSFDPCLSDILATFVAKATLSICSRENLVSSLTSVVKSLKVTHVLCTPTLWSLTLLHRFETQCLKEDFPCLIRIALGGEPIPKSLVKAWARKNEEEKTISCRLLATYGVTEACVYQTCGEIFSSGQTEPGQCVGHALKGNGFMICDEGIQGNNLVEVKPGMTGEIVLFGDQIDAATKYLNRPDLDGKFVKSINNQSVRYHYRTGDRGCIRDSKLVVLGRIVGEEGMIKINGVRVELGEIEAALLSGESNESDVSLIVTDCLVNFVKDPDDQNAIHAYCVFSDEIWKEVGMQEDTSIGVIINGGPLWTILRTKCSNRLRKACIPSAFVGIRQFPLSRTGKRDRSKLPGLDSCSFLDICNDMSTPLQDYGGTGGKVFETLVRYLNLQPCQQAMVTRSVSFAVLGGDSLSAVVVCRTLYAHYHQLQNSRHLGGAYGQLPVPFNTESLLRAGNLGEYVDVLDESIANNKLQDATGGFSTNVQTPSNSSTIQYSPPESSEQSLLYDALLQATTLDQTFIVSALLHLGADPNHGHNHGSRIGNTSGRNQRRAVFKAAPLHLACFRGNAILVNLLLRHKANCKSPNTNGLFPIHLAAGGLDDGKRGSSPQEEVRRLECVKSLMEAGCPLLIKDANKQSILHAAARAGHVVILKHAIEEHQSDRYNGPVPLKQFLEFQDKWFRSALHWAVLHGNVVSARYLLEKGSDPSPYKPRANNKYTSMMTETPLEICRRLHGTSEMGIELEEMLLAAIEASDTE